LPDGKKQTVMIVDDTDDVRELMAVQLRLSGYDVIEARDGQQAVELARRNCPALILMDIQMPVMDGVTATRVIRGIRELRRVVIVAFSAFTSGNNRRRALEAGCDGYVSKNDGIGQITSIVRRYLAA
jgi:two-component system cell cycle response regulator DivK